MYFLFNDHLDTFIEFKRGEELNLLHYYLIQYYKDLNHDHEFNNNNYHTDNSIENSLNINTKKRKWNF